MFRAASLRSHGSTDSATCLNPQFPPPQKKRPLRAPSRLGESWVLPSSAAWLLLPRVSPPLSSRMPSRKALRHYYMKRLKGALKWPKAAVLTAMHMA